MDFINITAEEVHSYWVFAVVLTIICSVFVIIMPCVFWSILKEAKEAKVFKDCWQPLALALFLFTMLFGLGIFGLCTQSPYLFNTKERLIKDRWERHQNNIPQYYSIQNGKIIEGQKAENTHE